MHPQQKPQLPQTQRVKVERAFYHKGELQKVGDKPTLPRVFALELKAANKVSFVDEEQPAARAAESKPAETGVAKDAKKGDK